MHSTDNQAAAEAVTWRTQQIKAISGIMTLSTFKITVFARYDAISNAAGPTVDSMSSLAARRLRISLYEVRERDTVLYKQHRPTTTQERHRQTFSPTWSKDQAIDRYTITFTYQDRSILGHYCVATTVSTIARRRNDRHARMFRLHDCCCSGRSPGDSPTANEGTSCREAA